MHVLLLELVVMMGAVAKGVVVEGHEAYAVGIVVVPQ